MEFFEAVRVRRSIRRFKPEIFPDDLVKKALASAILAPNSSNVQSWDFYWIKSSDVRPKVVAACLNQSAARTASHLLVITADPSKWKRSNPPLIKWVKSVNAPQPVVSYYENLVPIMYRAGFLNLLAPFKWIGLNFYGLFRPVARRPVSRRDLQEVSIKSAALAAENFVLAISALGGATCMMEGFDEFRLSRILKLPCSTRIVMVIGIGYEAEKGTWGPQFRLQLEEVVHVV